MSEASHRPPAPMTGSPLHLVQALQRAATDQAGQVAFFTPTQSLSYQALLARARNLAGTLVAAGVARGDRVAVILPRGLEVPVAVYGIWLAGAAYVPLDPELPVAQLLALIRECDVSALVTHPGLHAALADSLFDAVLPLSLIVGWEGPGETQIPAVASRHAAPCVSWSALCDTAAMTPLPDINPDDLAYIIHTSGSTGRPKGIMHTHASALRYAELSVEVCGLSAEDVIACHSALHTDMSSLGLFVAPLLGASTLMVPDSHVRVPASLARLIESAGVSVWYSVPLALLQLLQYGVLAQRDLQALRWVIYAGEPLAPAHVRALAALLPSARFSNHYGPAETNVCTYYHLPRNVFELPPDVAIPIGKPWGDNRCCLINAEGQPVDPGTAGELLVSTDTMMLGYWNRPELNRQVFVSLSIDGITARYYRTGDMAVETGTGDLQLLGRSDRQIKVRGYRVELDDIELSLSGFPGLAELSAFAVKADATLTLHLAVLDARAVLNMQALEAHARQVLAPAAVPQHFHRLTDFPRTSTGKVDRRSLVQTLMHTS